MVTMATWFHASEKPVSRSGGHSAVAIAAYRLGAKLDDARYAMSHDYRAGDGVVESFTLAPEGAPAWARDPQTPWNAAEAAEKRKDARVAREVVLALPAAATPEVRRQITVKMVEHLMDHYGVAVTVAIHARSREGDQRNAHAHILFSTRSGTAEGLGAKTKALDEFKSGPEEIQHIRERAAWNINNALEEAGLDEHVTHKTLRDQGIERLPTRHLGPDATEMARRGQQVDRKPFDPNHELEVWFDRLIETHDQAGPSAVHSDLERPDDPATREKKRMDEIATEIAEIDAEILQAKQDEDRHERDRQAEIAAIAEQIKAEQERQQSAKATSPDAPRDTDPAKAQVKDAAEPHREQIESGEGLHDILDDGQSWWQRSASQIRLRARQFRDMAWRSWETTKATWADLTRSVRDKENPRDIARDRDNDHER